MAAGTEQLVTLRISADARGVITAVQQASGELGKLGPAGETAANKATTAFGKTRQGVDSISTQLRKMRDEVIGIGAAWVGLQGGRAILQVADNYTNLSSKLRGVTEGERELARVREDAFGIAQDTRQEFESTATLYAQITRSTRDLGLTERERLRITETVNKAMVVGGAATQAANAAIVQLSQGLASGVLRGDEFNSVAEQAPILMDLLARSLGVTRGELRGMAEDGQLTADVLTSALLEGGAAVDAQFASMTMTISGAMTQLSNAFLKYVGEADSAFGISSVFAGVISLVAQNFEVLMTGVTAVALVFAGRYLSSLIASAAGKRALVVQTTALVAAELAEARSAEAAAASQLAKAQAMAVGFQGIERVALAETQLAAAQTRTAAATAASTAALGAKTGMLARMGSGLLGLVGGPIGAAVLAIAGLGYGIVQLIDAERTRVAQFEQGIDATVASTEQLNVMADAMAGLSALPPPPLARYFEEATAAAALLVEQQRALADEQARLLTLEREAAFASGSTRDGGGVRGAGADDLSQRLAEQTERTDRQRASLDGLTAAYQRAVAEGLSRFSPAVDVATASLERFMNAGDVRGSLTALVGGIQGVIDTANGIVDADRAAQQALAEIASRSKAVSEELGTAGKSAVQLAEALVETALGNAEAANWSEQHIDALRQQGADLVKNAKALETAKNAEKNRTEALREAERAQRDYERAMKAAQAQRDAEVASLSTLDRLIRANAGSYSGPMLDAVEANEREMQELHKATEALLDQGPPTEEMHKRIAAGYDAITGAAERRIDAARREQDTVGNLQRSYEEEIRLAGMSDEQRRVELATLQAIDEHRRNHNGTIDATTEAQIRQTVAAGEAGIRMQEQARETAEAYRATWTNAIGSVADAFGNWIADGAKSWKDFGDQLKNIAKRFIADIIAQFVKAQFAKLLSGGSGGGWMSMAAGAFGMSGGSGSGGGAGGAAGVDWTSMVTGGSPLSGTVGQTAGGWITANPGTVGTVASYGGALAGGYYGLTQRGERTGDAGSLAAMAAYGTLGYVGGTVAAGALIGASAGAATGVAGAAVGGAGLGAAGAAAAIPVIGWIVAIAAIVDLISGGRLFGTRFRPEAAESALVLAEQGADATAELREVRQRALFGGREWRTRDIDPGDEAREAAQQLFDIVRNTMSSAASELGADVPPMINAALRTVQTFDKKGRVKTTAIFVDILGRSWEEATGELAATRINAEAIIATIDHIMLGAADAITMGLDQVGEAVEIGTGGSAGGEGGTGGRDGSGIGGRMPGIDQLAKNAEVMVQSASDVAERWRHDAELLMAGAEFLLYAARDIVAGNALLGETADLGTTTDLIEDLQRGEESLVQTYQRVSAAAGLLDQALEQSGVVLDGTREDVVRFAVGIADAAGGLENAQRLWNNLFANFYDQFELGIAGIERATAEANALLEPLGFDTNTSREEYRAALEAALPTLTPEEVVQWLQAAAALDAIRDAAEELMTDVDAIIASAGPPPTFEDAMAALNADFDRLREQAIALGLTEEELTRIEQARTIAADQLREAQARAVSEYEDFFLDMGLEEFGTDFEREMRAIGVWTEDAIAEANNLARAAGMAAARESDLARIHEVAASRAARAIAQLRAATLSIRDELFGSPIDQLESQIAELEAANAASYQSHLDAIGTVGQASENRYARELQALQRIRGFLDDVLLDEQLTTLTPAQQLTESQSQFEAALAAAQGGDLDALEALPDLAAQYLREARFMFASGDQYSAIFDAVTGALGDLDAAGPQIDPEDVTGGSSSGSTQYEVVPSAELQALYEERDARLAEQEAAHRAQLAQDYIAHVRELSTATGATVFAIMEEQGVNLRELAEAMGADLTTITGASVEALASMASGLGVNLGDLTSALGLNLTDLAGGLTELTSGLGINLSALTTESAAALGTLLSGLGLSLEDFAAAVGMDLGASLGQLAADMGIDLGNLSTAQVGQLAALAGSLGTSLGNVAAQLGLDLGDLADEQGLLNDAVEAAIDALPAGQREKLQDLFRAVETATDEASARAATEALAGGVGELPEDLRAQLAPFFDEIPGEQVFSELDHLTTLAATAATELEVLRDSKSLLARIANNLRDSNSAAGIPSYAVGTNYVPRTGPAILHAGEVVLPLPLANLYRSGDLGKSANSASMDAVVTELRALRKDSTAAQRELVARLERLEQAEREAGREMARATDRQTEQLRIRRGM